MIDLHNHILPGVDDGAVDLPESLDIARQFVAEGVTRVAATPHLDPERGNGVMAAEVRQKVDELQAALSETSIALTVLPGHELYLTPDAPSLLQSGTVASLGNGPYVLVEVFFSQRPLYMKDTLFHLELAGYRPVLAHPERYAFLQRDMAGVDQLVEAGVVLQLTAPSLLGEYGPAIQNAAEEMLYRGAYAVAASDRHHPGSTRSLAQLHDRLTRLANADLADLLLRDNPARLLDGKRPIQPELQKLKRPSLFARLLR